MSYKERMKAEVEAIVAKGKDVDANIITMVKNDFKQIIADCKKSGTSLKNVTYETLDGIEEGLKVSGYETKKVLKESADAMVEVTKKSSDAIIEISRETAQKSKDALNEEISKAKDGIAGVNDKIKDKMQASYADFQEKTDAQKAHLQDVADGMKDYSIEKSHHLLSQSVDKTKDAINNINTSFKDHSKALLEHSKEGAANWLHSLANKIKKH